MELEQLESKDSKVHWTASDLVWPQLVYTGLGENGVCVFQLVCRAQLVCWLPQCGKVREWGGPCGLSSLACQAWWDQFGWLRPLLPPSFFFFPSLSFGLLHSVLSSKTFSTLLFPFPTLPAHSLSFCVISRDLALSRIAGKCNWRARRGAVVVVLRHHEWVCCVENGFLAVSAHL